MLETFLLTVLAFALGWKLNEIIMAASFKKIMEELKIPDSALEDLARRNGIKISQEPDAKDTARTEIEIRIEQVEGDLFAYDARDLFVAQAKDADTLLTRIIERFPAGTRITVNKEHGGDLIKAAAARLKTQS